MTLASALSEIKKFWPADQAFPFGQSNHDQHIERLETEFGMELPESLKDYVKNYAPAEDFYFDTVGNPMCVYGIENLKHRQDGYNFNPVTNQAIEDWDDNLFIFADEGADPVVVELDNIDEGIQKCLHGMGSWDSGLYLADHFGQFLLCCAAQHHALNNFEEEAIIDDENGFNLAPKAAKWYFPNMKKWAGDYADDWCSVFDNF